MEKDILLCGEKELQELKKIILERNRYKAVLNTLNEEIEHRKEAIEQWKQGVEKEVLAEEQKRRNEVVKPFLDEIAVCEAEVARVMEERDKKRRELIDALIREENEKYEEKKKILEDDIVETRKEEKVPSICLTKVFLALFCPRTGKDVLVLIGGIVLFLLVLPLGIYYGIYGGGDKSVLTTIYLLDIIFFYTGYLLINNLVKDKYLVGLKKILALLAEQEKMEIRRKQKLKELENVPDSSLDLGEFTEELDRLQAVIGEVKNQSDLALINFDSDERLKQQIAKEVWESRHSEQVQLEQALEETRTSYDKCKSELEKFKQDKKMEETYDTLLRIEKNIFNVDVIDELIYILRNGDAENIRSAIFKRQKKLGVMPKLE